jgi:hypothetical protein
MNNEPKDVEFGDPELMVPEGMDPAILDLLKKYGLTVDFLERNREGLSGTTIMKVLSTANFLNEILADKTVLSVERGSSPGWLVINLTPPSADCRCFLTVWCGGIREHLEPEHDWDIALHHRQLSGDGWGLTNVIYRSHQPEGPEICHQRNSRE